MSPSIVPRPVLALVSALLLVIMAMNSGAQTPSDSQSQQGPDET